MPSIPSLPILDSSRPDDAHLSHIDPEQWPGVAHVPDSIGITARARLAEAAFARACARAGLSTDPAGHPDLEVLHEALFYRIAESGWLGFAESWMAGEWRASNLAHVLEKLISVGYQPRTVTRSKVRPDESEEAGEGIIPPALVGLTSFDGLSVHGGMFASGVPTTVRTKVSESTYADVTEWSAPVDVERADIRDAHARAVEKLLDACEVRAGTQVLELPIHSGAVTAAAAHRRAIVDAMTTHPELASWLKEQLVLQGVDDAVHIGVTEKTIPAKLSSRYDAIISTERYELLPHRDRSRMLAIIDRTLAPGGRAGLQSLVALPALNQSGIRSMDAIRAYIWPELSYPKLDQVRQNIAATNRLYIETENHFGVHYAYSAELQAKLFVGNAREAAAEGFDSVYRKLWEYYFGVKQALLNLQMIDAVQFTVATRSPRTR